MKKLLIITLTIAIAIYPWSAKEVAEAKNINFYGLLETHEGQIWDIQNIKIGKDREAAHIKHIIMYDKPKDYISPEKNIITLTNDPVSMTYSEISLNEIDTIEVPNPEVSWIYKKDNAKYGIEYKEVTVTHKDKKKGSYLVELGRQDIPRKVKLFCSVRHTYKKENNKLDVQETGNGLFCKGVSLDELEEKGIPLQAIKKVTIEGFCHQILVQ